MRTCRDVLGLLTEYVEEGLTKAETHRLEGHLKGCGACQAFLESLKATRDAVRGLRIDAIPDDCHRRLHRFLEGKPRRRPR